jgi:NTE family protein
MRWAARLVSGGLPGAPRVRGLVDTAPLREFLQGALGTVEGEIVGIRENVERGLLRAVAITTLSYTTGQSITWVDGCDIVDWEVPNRRSARARLGLDHVMASAALPLVFPAAQIGGHWHGDGSIRLASPLSPAIHLGADRILAISARYARSFEEADEPTIQGYPPPAQVIGQLMSSIFLDLLDQDARRLRRINGLLDKLPPEAHGDLRPIELLVLRPSVDLGRLAAEFEHRLPQGFRFLTRGLGTRETASPDFLSLLMFEPEYLNRLIAIGEADAEQRGDELLAFVAPTRRQQAARG